MNTQKTVVKSISAEALAGLGGPNLVYVREIDPAELSQVEGLPAGLKLFAIHSADGTRVGVVGDRDAAFAAARQHDMEPVSVH
jgi:hypothetical protein